MNMLNLLKKSVANKNRLEDLVSAFEDMCKVPLENVDIDDDGILFETGTFDFTGEPLFYFSLVRQFPNEDEEYYQIHLDILYTPTELTENYNQSEWCFGGEMDIFDYVRNSQEFLNLKDKEIKQINVFIDET